MRNYPALALRSSMILFRILLSEIFTKVSKLLLGIRLVLHVDWLRRFFFYCFRLQHRLFKSRDTKRDLKRDIANSSSWR